MADELNNSRINESARSTSLHQVARDLLGVHNAPDVLQRVVELSRQAAGAQAGCLQQIRADRDEVEVLASAGSAAPAVGARVPYRGSLEQRVVEQGAPEVVRADEVAWRPLAAHLHAEAAGRTLLLLPLLAGLKPVGALLLFRDADQPEFADEEVSRLALLADMAALTLQRILLEEEVAQRIQQLEHSERSFRLLVHGVKDYAIFMLDPEGRIVSWNEGARRIKGYEAEEILGQHFSRFYTDEDRARNHPAEELRIAVLEGSYEEEGWRIRRDGSRFWAHVTLSAIRDDTGALLGFSKVTRDLTERRRHEGEREQLLSAEQAARREVSTILGRITDAFFALDQEWRFIYMNHSTREAVRSILGRDPDEIMRHSFWDVVPQFRGTRFEEEYRRAMETQQPAHFVEYSEGLDTWFDVHAYPSPDGLSVYFRDVTQQKQVERAAELERRRLRAVLDALPAGVFICDAGGRILETNQAAQRLWGGELPLAQRPEEYGVYGGLSPATGEPLLPEEWPLARALHTGAPVGGEEIEIETSTGARKTILAYAHPFHDGTGEVVGAVAVTVDITDRQRLLREAQAARTEAERANRAKSEFLATMSHEIRTPINAIMGYTDLLEMGLAGPINPAQRTQLERVRASSTHLLGLINDILDLAKVEAGRMSVARDSALAQHAISAALALVGPQAAERGVELTNECGQRAHITYCGDEDRVRQILVNLLSNAVKFTESGGRITLRCGQVPEPPAEARVSGEGPWVCIEVEDTGAGIPADKLESVFQPFVQADQTSTRTRGGTGLGLTISRKLAQLMGGDITGRSELGAGSVFTLWLPGPQPEERDAAEPAEGPRRAALVVVGKTLLEQAQPILKSFSQRIREDPTFLNTRELTNADLQDHGVAFLTDIAQSLVALEESQVEPQAMLRDGGEIQRVISVLHGEQRARIGWGEEQVHREFQILREEVYRAIQPRLQAVPEEEHAAAMAVLTRFLDSAEEISCRALREVQE